MRSLALSCLHAFYIGFLHDLESLTGALKFTFESCRPLFVDQFDLTPIVGNRQGNYINFTHYYMSMTKNTYDVYVPHVDIYLFFLSCEYRFEVCSHFYYCVAYIVLYVQEVVTSSI